MNAVHHESSLYERLATQLAGLIHAETLRPGDRLPSVRSLSEQQRVSVSTVLQAYVLLENRGLIETRPQSGHYVRPRLLTLAAEPKMSRPSTMATRPSVTDSPPVGVTISIVCPARSRPLPSTKGSL